jgi:hypothetical protein
LWRWFVWGGDQHWQRDLAWVFSEVFTEPDRAYSAPIRER